MIFAKGQTVPNAPESLRDFVLLQALPGYTREDLDNEDPEWLEEIRTYLQTEAAISKQKS